MQGAAGATRDAGAAVTGDLFARAAGAGLVRRARARCAVARGITLAHGRCRDPLCLTGQLDYIRKVIARDLLVMYRLTRPALMP